MYAAHDRDRRTALTAGHLLDLCARAAARGGRLLTEPIHPLCDLCGLRATSEPHIVQLWYPAQDRWRESVVCAQCLPDPVTVADA